MGASIPEAMERAPTLRWRDAALAVALFVLGVAVLEGVLARRGIYAHPPSTVRVWVEAYEGALADPQGLALIGSSRAALGFDPPVLSRTSGMTTYNLTINGGNPIPVLERLVADGFAGTALVEVMETRFFSADLRGWEGSASYLDQLDNPSLVAGVEDRLVRAVAGRFRTRSAAARLTAWIRLLPRGKLPGPPERSTRGDRFEVTDVSRIDGPALDARWAHAASQVVPFPAARQALVLDHLTDLSAQLGRGGGSIRWVRLPSSGKVGAIEEATFPRAAAFDRVGAPETRWHFADDPSTAGLTCFDGSHLPPASAVVLSAALGRWIRAGHSAAD